MRSRQSGLRIFTPNDFNVAAHDFGNGALAPFVYLNMAVFVSNVPFNYAFSCVGKKYSRTFLAFPV